MPSIEKVMEHSEMGYARHKVIYDEEGKPVDYQFLAVNRAFEKLTGVQRENILDKRVTEVLPEIKEDSFDWIRFFGKIAREGDNKRFERYSLPLDRWYKVEAFSAEPGYFTTLFSDVIDKKNSLNMRKTCSISHNSC